MALHVTRQTWGQFNSEIGNDYLKTIGIGKFGIGIEVSYKKIKSTNEFTIFTMLTLTCGVTNILEPK